MAQVRCEMCAIVEKARTSTSHDDSDLSDDDREPAGFNTVKTLIGIVDQWNTVPIGGGNRSTALRTERSPGGACPSRGS